MYYTLSLILRQNRSLYYVPLRNKAISYDSLIKINNNKNYKFFEKNYMCSLRSHKTTIERMHLIKE